MHSSNSPLGYQRWQRAALMFAAFAIIALMLWGWGLWAGHFDPEGSKSAQFRDPQLGFANALLACLALGGALYTLYLNQTQLDNTLAELNQSNRLAHYAELDRLYFDLLELAVERPWLRQPDTLRDEAQRAQYDAYAYMVWNFIETVVDRLDSAPPDNRRLPAPGLDLEATWKPTLNAEVALHVGWLRTQGNIEKFKATFLASLRKRLDAKLARMLPDPSAAPTLGQGQPATPGP